jgi:hypothetical protein
LQAQIPEFKSEYSQKKKKKLGSKDITQWESVCPACARPWVQFPNIAKSKKKKMVRRINGTNATYSTP